MFYSTENGALNTLGPALLIAACTIFYFKRQKPPKKEMNTELLNTRILAYKPEPLIDYSKIDTNSKKVVEIPVPDESIPGCLNLAKVNYLNFLNNLEFRKEAESCIRTYGVGSCGPRGFYGTIDIHLNLENRIAQFMKMEESVLYSYAFTTVSSAIGAYCKRSDIIFCDEKINFPATQGFLAAKSTIVYFKHNDMIDLELKLKEYEKKEKQRKKLYRKFLVVEGIYAASGTLCPLPKLMELREKYMLRIFIDESISFGILGKQGRGITEHFNIDRSEVDMIIGSLETSIGSIGGFCVGASVIIEHQRLSGLGYCFSASLPPFLSHVAICALDIFEKQPEMFGKLQTMCIDIDQLLRNIEECSVISDPLSPLKVITTKKIENRGDLVHEIHANCSKQNIHMICAEDCLKFNVNIALEVADISKLLSTLKTEFQLSN